MPWNRSIRSVRPGIAGEMRAARQAEGPATTAAAWITEEMPSRVLSRAGRARTTAPAGTAVRNHMIVGGPTIHSGAVRQATDSPFSSDSRSRTR